MKIRSKILYIYLFLAIAYIALTLIPNPDKLTILRYHLSPIELRWLYVSLIIPLLFIWFTAFYGYQKLQVYAKFLRQDKNSRGVQQIANGLLAFGIGIALSSIFSNILNLIARHHTSFLPASVVISNYMSALYPLIAFMFIARGAWNLSNAVKAKPSLWMINLVVFVVIALGIGLCALIQIDHAQLRTTYHMAPALVMITLAIPATYVWFLGLFSVVELYLYSQKVSGIVFRRAWRQVSLGIGGIILVSIILQYIGTFAAWLNGLTLHQLLLLLYVLLLLFVGAFIVIALGSNKLIKIEEV